MGGAANVRYGLLLGIGAPFMTGQAPDTQYINSLPFLCNTLGGKKIK